MNSPTFYKDLADAIYLGDTNSHPAFAGNRSDEITLSETVVVNGRTLIPGATLKIQRPASHQ
jgi:hypothetical protein